MRSYYLDSQCRGEYLRMMIKILIKKYHVNRSSLARGIGMRPTHMNDFMAIEDRVAKPRTLDRIETYLDDLYESIITDETNANYAFIEELKKRSQESIISEGLKIKQKNTTR